LDGSKRLMLFEPFKLNNTTFNQYKTLKKCKNSGKQRGIVETNKKESRTYILEDLCS